MTRLDQALSLRALGAPAPMLPDWAQPRRGIRLECAWLGDELEHERDRWALRALLVTMEGLPLSDRFQHLLENTIALFRLHVLIQSRLYAIPELRAMSDHLFTLIEQIERAGPDNPLYLSQSASLRFGIELILTLENELRAQHGDPCPPDLEPALLQARCGLFDQLNALLRTSGRRYSPPLSSAAPARPRTPLH